MRNILLCSFLLLSALSIIPAVTHAQMQQAPISNIEGNAKSIISKLKNAISLTEEQQPKILDAVMNFLQQRSSILPLNNSNPKVYNTKLKGYQTGLQRKLKSTLTPEQFTGFLELKPVNNDMTNVLSQLFY
jgi:hypothetical protein